MIRFLVTGLLRDRHRSIFPIITVTIGVMLTVFMHCWITGVMGDMADFSGRFLTGHVKIVTKSYAENIDQMPMDLSLIEVNDLIQQLNTEFPDWTWISRIPFGGLLDAPDENGETRSQGPAIGMAIDLSLESTEIERLNITKSIVKGSLPDEPYEILLSDIFADKLEVKVGDVVTLLTSTMYGSMAMQNFTVSGTVQFGVLGMDSGAMIVDIEDARNVLDMQNASSEILGYLPGNTYNESKIHETAEKLRVLFPDEGDEFAPFVLELREQNDLASILDYADSMTGVVVSMFLVVMSIVLWNAGLLGGLRRYGEFGVRLAMGETKGHIYRSMFVESLSIGVAGSFLGTIVGLLLAYWVQQVGFDISSMMKQSTMMVPTVFRARITNNAYYVGLLPGLFSTLLGTMLAGTGIYRRKTAQLFKELEA